MVRHKLLAGLVAVLLLAGLVVGAFALGLGPRDGDDAESPSSSTPTVGPPPLGPGLELRTPPPAPAVLAGLSGVTGRTGTTAGRLRRHLTEALGRPALDSLGLAVAELGEPGVLLHVGESTVTPASTLKLVTSTAALATLGPDHRFMTTVVQDRQPGSIVLVGGGDPLLADTVPSPAPAPAPAPAQEDSDYPRPASLQRLAAATASRLRAQGVRRVSLTFDDSLFTGPPVNPRWPATYISDDVVSPISALWIDEGRTTPGLAERSADPALAAALAFSDRLAEVGIEVVAAPVRDGARGPRPTVLASVASPPLDEIVEHVLETSDNEGAEVLLRQVAIAGGRTGSSPAGVAAVRRALAELGVDAAGAVVYDGSGLSRDDAVPVRLLVQVLQTAAAPADPDLRAVVTGLPVAGFNGSLGYRFDREGGGAAGLGYVRAKTGTLTGVHGLAGLAATRSGQVLVFVAVADNVPVPLTLAARDDLDALAAALATCGC